MNFEMISFIAQQAWVFQTENSKTYAMLNYLSFHNKKILKFNEKIGLKSNKNVPFREI